jgi:hypothetical protein
MRYAARRDANEEEIVSGLRAIGCLVEPLSQRGIPDLLVGLRGRWVLLEIKGKRGELTPAQRRFCAVAWAAHLPVAVVRTLDDALEALDLRVVGGSREQ